MGECKAALTALVITLAACGTSTRTAQPASAEDDHWVRDIALSELRGQVGRPFESQLSYRDNFIREPEFEVSGLPAGLRFDAAKRAVVGTPRQAGFFVLNVAVRKKVPPDETHLPSADERWWPASFELEIYKPME